MTKRSQLLLLVIAFLAFLLSSVIFVKSILISQNNRLRVSKHIDTYTFPVPLPASQMIASNSRSATSMPAIMYGTAWKKHRTQELVQLAVKSGFRGIDTACQPKHYFEPGVGDALQGMYNDGIVKREEIFLQTKFTSLNGQDPKNIPYDPAASLDNQVRQSFAASCKNLHTDYLDSLVLHSPMKLYEETLLVWRTMEELFDMGAVLQLGISNTYDLSTLERLYNDAKVKPTVLQNRFYADSGYDIEIRKFCTENGIRYQSFWTLTANPQILKS
jgi:diketogulonate reductase-like aldo/keto reductase